MGKNKSQSYEGTTLDTNDGDETPVEIKVDGTVLTAAQQVKRDRFLRLAPKRMNNLLRHMRHVAACAKRSQYYYTAEESKKILSVLAEEYRQIETAFMAGDTAQAEFAL